MSSLDGIWQTVIDSPMGTREGELQLEQDGQSLTGVLIDGGSPVAVEGSADGAELELVATLANATGPLLVTFTGQINDDSIDGDVEFGDQGIGAWSARRGT